MELSSRNTFIELEIAGLTQGTSLHEAYILILKEKASKRLMPLLIEHTDFLRLKLAMTRRKFPDLGLMLQLASSYRIQLEKVVLRAPKNGETPASLFFTNPLQEEQVIQTDATSGILVAMKSECPLLTYRSLFERQIGQQKSEDQIAVPITIMSKQLLNEALQAAVLEENFELASQLRD
jgi:bifunctional DNase/RNase